MLAVCSYNLFSCVTYLAKFVVADLVLVLVVLLPLLEDLELLGELVVLVELVGQIALREEARHLAVYQPRVEEIAVADEEEHL